MSALQINTAKGNFGCRNSLNAVSYPVFFLNLFFHALSHNTIASEVGPATRPAVEPTVVVSRFVEQKTSQKSEDVTNGNLAPSKVEVLLAPSALAPDPLSKAGKTTSEKTENFKLGPKKAVLISLGAFLVVGFFFRRRILNYILDENRPLPPVQPFGAKPIGEILNKRQKNVSAKTKSSPRSRFTLDPTITPPQTVVNPEQIPVAASQDVNTPFLPESTVIVLTTANGQQTAIAHSMSPVLSTAKTEETIKAFKRLKVRPKRPWE